MGELGEVSMGEVTPAKRLVEPKTISKEIDPGGRTEMARTALGARAEAKTTQEGLTDREQKIQQIAELTSISYQQEQEKAQELTQRLHNIVVRVKNLVGVGDKQAAGLQTEIEAIKEKRRELNALEDGIKDELEELKQQQSEIPKPKQLLEAYYEKVSTAPLSNDQKRDLLKPEVLASLSSDEYIRLLQRLNPHFLSHVTRQGFRDHNAMFYHEAGLQEFHKGFLGVMQDEKLLRPPLALGELKTRDEASVEKWMGNWVLEAENEAQARERLNTLLHSHLASAPKYPDKTAVHFATQLVADAYYGGEGGNEIFFIFPSDVIASQHDFAFNGQKKDFTRPQSEIRWNDVFVWPNTVDNPGITIDAGMVFLPENTPVDPETGSKYASEVKVIDGQEKRVMIEDAVLVESFVDWGKKLDGQSPFRQAFDEYNEERNYDRQQAIRGNCFAVCIGELQGLGFHIDAAAALANEMIGEMYARESFDAEKLLSIIRGSGAHWKRAENPIPSKDYWEKFFTINPNLRPKHLRYYDGDPTTAVLRFQQQNGIGKADTSKTDGQLLGFDDHHVTDMGKDPRSNAGLDELVETANKIITKHYKGSTATNVAEEVTSFV